MTGPGGFPSSSSLSFPESLCVALPPLHQHQDKLDAKETRLIQICVLSNIIVCSRLRIYKVHTCSVIYLKNFSSSKSHTSTTTLAPSQQMNQQTYDTSHTNKISSSCTSSDRNRSIHTAETILKPNIKQKRKQYARNHPTIMDKSEDSSPIFTTLPPLGEGLPLKLEPREPPPARDVPTRTRSRAHLRMEEPEVITTLKGDPPIIPNPSYCATGSSSTATTIGILSPPPTPPRLTPRSPAVSRRSSGRLQSMDDSYCDRIRSTR